MMGRRPLRLRTRAAVAFGLIGLFASATLAAGTYLVTRAYLLNQRQASAERQVFANGRLTRSALRPTDVDVAALLTTIRGDAGSDVVLHFEDEWYSSSVGSGRNDVPQSLQDVVASGHAGRALRRAADGGLELVVGTPLAAVDADYFEVFSLEELERTLGLLRNAVILGAGLVSVVAAGLGRYAAGRVLGPLGPVTAAAARIADGDLKTRLPERGDPDLTPLTEGFNSMAASLEERIDREVRFTSDVSHELRSPLAALRAALEVIDRRRADLPEAVESAFEIIQARVQTFEELVLDLLEISRIDADAVTLDRQTVDVETFVRHVLLANDAVDVAVHLPPSPVELAVDRRRLAQGLGNIISNAARYAGGVTDLTVATSEHEVTFLIDDAGPGIDHSERHAVFGRFARGSAGRRRGSGSGTGLGLALARAHVELHGGTVDIATSPGGGARFVVTLPLGRPP
jgi:two-component system, OmpR family, sensor histidine kinase MtrB